ncbi:hypothetical protein GCM10009601_60010 [Streptomyces thermospinosisporus]|uniref:Uncharacterized protein n=1 Tax=Streptomyces thermospinosisporus TaxID=161482 RepID=A0ABP4JXN5_9ACTN
MTNELSPADIAYLVEIEVQRRMQQQEKDNGQLTREQLNGMTWQEICEARAQGRLDSLMYGGE